jgi:sulfoxide reductase catalytic subunit YedY
MIIRTRKKSDVAPSEITSESVYQQRRRFIQAMGVGMLGGLSTDLLAKAVAPEQRSLSNIIKSPYSTDEEQTSYKDATQYNNFYELGTGKRDPYIYSKKLKPRPWSISLGGHCEKPGTFDIDDFIKPYQLEERIYRLRCVEGWSMVIPWVGIPLADIIRQAQPTSNAKYVAFETLNDPSMLPGQRTPILKWPYVEGLRMDEAMHPLTILSVGIYGKELPNQNGAPIRLVVPWKYGFKSIKSIVKISFVEQQPPATWNEQAPDEYGFYSNVNPEVDHPRWSQSRERRLGEFLKRDTQMFNGYEEEVASLYSGMDLRKHY